MNFQQITMPYLAALVPAHWDIRHVDEAVTPVDVGVQADLVAITFHTPSAYHAYELASRFRHRGIPVVLGGPHVTLLPDEAQGHADAIIVGEAEETWPEFLQDFERGQFAPRYEAGRPPPLERAPLARQEFYHRRDYTAGRLFATRGCRHRCDFCAVALMYQRPVRKRPIEQVAAEYASFPGRVVIFWDDNIGNDREYAKALFRAIAPYRKWWSSQASLDVGDDDEFLAEAARSGCKQLFIGLESISQASLDGVRKPFNRVDEYARVIERIHRHGIAVQAGIVFGFDQDTERVFGETVEFLEGSGVQNATFNILTPFPGTALHDRLAAEGRILTRDWRKYNGRADVVFAPRQMSAATLLAGYRETNRRFYSPKSIRRRCSRSPVGWCWVLPLNLAYMMAFRWMNLGNAFARDGGDGMRLVRRG